jgi:uncharacterized protein YjdB
MNHPQQAAIVFALIIPVIACGGKMAGPTAPSPAPVVASNLTITGFTSLSGTGETGRLTAMVTFADGTVQDKSNAVQWSSADQKVATVDSSGLVTALTDGHTTVTATFANVTGARMIHVDLPPSPFPTP